MHIYISVAYAYVRMKIAILSYEYAGVRMRVAICYQSQPALKYCVNDFRVGVWLVLVTQTLLNIDFTPNSHPNQTVTLKPLKLCLSRLGTWVRMVGLGRFVGLG